MLKEYQIRELLRLCEEITGKKLDTVRGNLRSNQKIPAIWELLVFDSLTAIGKVEYEPISPGSSDIDFCVTLESGAEIWADAAWIIGRLSKEKRKAREVIRRVYAYIDETESTLMESITWRLIATKTSRGYEHKMPAPQDYKQITNAPTFLEFLQKCQEFPDEKHFCDLSGIGFSINFSYERREPRHLKGFSGGGQMGDRPSTVEDHPLYRTLEKKNGQMKRSRVSRPFVPIIGEHATGLFSTVSWEYPSLRQVLYRAFGEFSYISGVVIVSLESAWNLSFEDTSELSPNVGSYQSIKSTNPIDANDWEKIEAMSFRRWGYTYTDTPLSYSKDMKTHRDKEGGRALSSPIQPNRPWTLTLPEHYFRQLLCGEKTFDQIGYGLEGYDKILLNENRSVTGVEFIKGDPRKQIPDMVKVSFGPKRERVY